MAVRTYISDSEEEGVSSFPIRRGAPRGPSAKKTTPASRSPDLLASQSPPDARQENGEHVPHARDGVLAMEVVIPRAPSGALDKYVEMERPEDIIDVNQALERDGETEYEVEFGDARTEMVSSFPISLFRNTLLPSHSALIRARLR